MAFCWVLFSCEEKELKAGDLAPNFTGFTPEGKEVSLSDFKGTLVYINFWSVGTFDSGSVKELPYFQKLQHFYRENENIVFVGASMDNDKDEDLWRAMLAYKSLAGVQLRIKDVRYANIWSKYAIRRLPHFVLVGKDGKVIAPNAPPPSTEKQIKNLINKNI